MIHKLLDEPYWEELSDWVQRLDAKEFKELEETIRDIKNNKPRFNLFQALDTYSDRRKRFSVKPARFEVINYLSNNLEFVKKELIECAEYYEVTVNHSEMNLEKLIDSIEEQRDDK